MKGNFRLKWVQDDSEHRLVSRAALVSELKADYVILQILAVLA